MTKRLHFHFSLSCIGEGNGTPLQYSCLENPRDGGAWWAAIYGVTQSWTRLKRLSSSSISRVCSNSYPLSRRCHPTISSSVIPFFSCLQSFPVLGSFSTESALRIRCQSIGASTSASVLPMNIHSEWIYFRINLFDLLAVHGTLKSLLQHHSSWR